MSLFVFRGESSWCFCWLVLAECIPLITSHHYKINNHITFISQITWNVTCTKTYFYVLLLPNWSKTCCYDAHTVYQQIHLINAGHSINQQKTIFVVDVNKFEYQLLLFIIWSHFWRILSIEITEQNKTKTVSWKITYRMKNNCVWNNCVAWIYSHQSFATHIEPSTKKKNNICNIQHQISTWYNVLGFKLSFIEEDIEEVSQRRLTTTKKPKQTFLFSNYAGTMGKIQINRSGCFSQAVELDIHSMAVWLPARVSGRRCVM